MSCINGKLPVEGSIGTIISSFSDIGDFVKNFKEVPKIIKRYWNIDFEEMIEAKVHLGSYKRTWHPKITPYILLPKYKSLGIHITNPAKTARFLSEACDLLFDAASKKENILIVGTQKFPEEVADLVVLAGIRARCHYVHKKWFRGMLTNWSITRRRLSRLWSLKLLEEDGTLNSIPKKYAAMLKRELSTLETYLGGIKYMRKLPDIVIIIDQQTDYIAFRECLVLGLPIICLIDTDCDPDLVHIPIPVNNRDIVSIRWILNKLASAICEGNSRYIKRGSF